MSINSIDLKLPQLDSVTLRQLHQGDVFMLVAKDNFYRPEHKVYMLLPIEPLNPQKRCVCLLDGSLSHFGERTKVVRLKITIECSYCRPDDDDGLPF